MFIYILIDILIDVYLIYAAVFCSATVVSSATVVGSATTAFGPATTLLGA